jgi:hypothetical protein
MLRKCAELTNSLQKAIPKHASLAQIKAKKFFLMRAELTLKESSLPPQKITTN